jgi:uncharacterized protein (TIGR03083 family)
LLLVIIPPDGRIAMEGTSATAFKAASMFLLEVVAALSPEDWDREGLGSWNVRELVAHANRAHTTVEEYLLRPQPPEPRGSGYFSEAAIAERARESLQALGDDPAAAVATCSERVTKLIDGAAQDATIGSPVGTMTLAAYLPSRTAELTIHGIDLLNSLRRTTPPVPIEAIAESLSFTAGRAVSRGNGELLLLATSGRAELPEGFSVY